MAGRLLTRGERAASVAPGKQLAAAHESKASPSAAEGLATGQAAASRIDPPAGSTPAHRAGDLDQRLDRYRAALAERPADPALLDNVGQVLVAMDRAAEAVPFLKKAVEAAPSNTRARFNAAVAQARAGQLREAVDEYATLVRSGAADARTYHNMGLALRQLGRQTEAVAAFEAATTMAPEEAPAWLGLALSLEAQGRGREAAAVLDRYLALEPDAPDVETVRARIARLRTAAVPSSPPPPDPGNATPRRCP